MSAVHARVADHDGESWAEVDYYDQGVAEVYLEVRDGSHLSREPVSAVAIFTPAQAFETARALEAAAREAGYEDPA